MCPPANPTHPLLSPATRRRGPLVPALALGGLVALAVVVGWGTFTRTRTVARPAGLRTEPVRRQPLEQAIVLRGDLEPAESSDIVVRVGSLRRNSTYATTIKEIVEDGTMVKRGQVLAVLDDTEYRESLEERAPLLEQARVTWVQAEETYKVLRQQNEAEQLTAESQVTIAELELRKFLDGDVVQTRKDLEGQLALAGADREMADGREAWAERMLRRDYIGGAQYRAEAARQRATDYALSRLREQRRVYDTYTAARTRLELEAKLREAKTTLARLRAQGRAKLAQADATRLTAERIYVRRLQRYREIEEMVRRCVLRAPHDGMVIYAGSNARFGGFQQAVVAQGEPVREGQVLMRVPNLSRMVVQVRLHEALVSRVHSDTWEATGWGDAVVAGLLTAPGPMTRIVGLAAFDEVRPAFHDREQRQTGWGQRALVRVAGHSDEPLRAHVKQVAALASRIDAMSGEINVYRTTVAIDDPVDDLKPDLSAEVTIFADGSGREVLAVPIEAVVHKPGEGNDCHVFVLTPDGPEEREVRIGAYNDRLVELRAGVAEGEEVVLNPRLLLQERDAEHATP